MGNDQLKFSSHAIRRIAISRTDAIGDVILTLPLCGFLKSKYPGTKIDFIARDYTKAILERSENIDSVILDTKIEEYFKNDKPDALIMVFPDKRVSEQAKKYKVKERVGTSHRWWHWLHLNRRVDFSRKNSDLHESQLNFELLKGLGINEIPTLEQMSQYLGIKKSPKEQSSKKRILFHPKSKGSARDWPLSNYKKLASILSKEDYEIFVTGTEKEAEIISEEDPHFFEDTAMQNHLGKYSLTELIDVIGNSDAIVACSTGPLHIAAIQGVFALGLYPPLRPMHPGRWAPIGKNVKTMTGKKHCNSCPVPSECDCMRSILPENVATELKSFFNSRDL